MDWAYKVVLTGLAVAAVMMTARWMGRGAAGLLAGLPVITAPALVWLVAEQGTVVAARSAAGGLAACAAAPLFALVYARTSRRHGVPMALGSATLVLGLSLAALHPLRDQVVLLLALAVGCAFLVRCRLRDESRDGGLVRAVRGEPWLSATLAGAVGGGSALLATQAGPFWAGATAALPLISGFALVHLHRAGSAADVARFVVGYAPGVAAKAVFLFTFAVLAPPLDAVAALALAAAAGALTASIDALPRSMRADGGPLDGSAIVLPPRAR